MKIINGFRRENLKNTSSFMFGMVLNTPVPFAKSNVLFFRFDEKFISWCWRLNKYLDKLLKLNSRFPKTWFTCANKRPLKLQNMLFYFTEKLFSFLRYLNCCPNFFGHLGKWLDKKDNVNLKNLWRHQLRKYIAIHRMPTSH